MGKPANEGSSIGMSEAHSAVELQTAIDKAFEYDTEVLIEQWITGREVTVSVLNGKALPIIEMRTSHEFYDYDAKYQSNDTQYHCPCGLPPEEEQQLQQLAQKAFKATGAKGWGRVDVMRSETGVWQLLEVNTVPGMTESSLVPKAAKVHGLSFNELVSRIIELSIHEDRLA